MPTEEFINQVMKNVISVLCQNIGWHAAQTTSVDILADLMKRYFLQLAKSTHNYAEHYGRTSTNMDDAFLALRDNGLSVSELEEYIQNFDPVVLPYAAKVPDFPLPKESKLNFLRPGSEEVLTRPVYVHEYMPPMIFEQPKPKEEKEQLVVSNEVDEVHPVIETSKKDEEEAISSIKSKIIIIEDPKKIESCIEIKLAKVKEKSPEKEIPVVVPEVTKMEIDQKDGDDSSDDDDIESLENGLRGGQKKFTPFSGLSKTKRDSMGENPALKRVRMMLEEEGHPLREITSVMMTTSGFLTSSREGRLPETRPPPMSREFFEPLPPPPLEKKKKGLTMKRIVEGVKKIDKEKENDSDKDTEEPELFGNPDKITTSNREVKSSKDSLIVTGKEREDLDQRKSKKLKKLKLDKEMMKKLAKGFERDKKKLKIFKKSQQQKAASVLDKALLKKSKKFKLKEFSKAAKATLIAKQESLDNIDSDEDFTGEIGTLGVQPAIAPMIIKSSFNKNKDKTPDLLKIRKYKEKSLSPANLIPQPKISPHQEGKKLSPISLTTTPLISPDDGQMKKKRGRPRKNPLLLTPAALANLGKSLMKEERPLKIKKSHMEPDIRSLIPEISMGTPPIPEQKQPHKATRPPPNLDLLMSLPSAPGLIPSGFGVPGGVKMSQHIPPSISITPATASIISSPIKDKNHLFGVNNPTSLHHTNVCNSITITPIDMPNNQKLPTPYDKTVTPGIGSPSMSMKGSNKGSLSKDKSPNTNMPIHNIKTSSTSGITITPIVMKEERFIPNEQIETRITPQQHPPHPAIKLEKGSGGMLGKLNDDLKSKEMRKKDKERRKELKKEKKKVKKEKEKMNEGKVDKEVKKEKKDKSEKKKDKEKKKEKVLSEVPTLPFIPKLTLKLSVHSGTSTPVDSPNPPQVTIGDYDHPVLPPPPPLTPAPKKIVFKPIEEQRKMTDSSELARFSPLVTRPLPGRAAKAHAAAAVAADAMGALMGHQIGLFPPDGPSHSSRKVAKGRPSGTKGSVAPIIDKPDKSSKANKVTQQVTLVTETVGCIMDEQGNKIWICPTCGRQDDGSPMIGCDICDDWYHFTCVGITDTPEEDSQWYCPRCKGKKKSKDKKK